MFDYLAFENNWPSYTGTDKDSKTFYLYPADVAFFEGGQFSKQSAEGFFPDLLRRIEAIGDPRMDDLTKIVSDGNTIADKAIAERNAENCTYDQKKDPYTMTNGKALQDEAQALYNRYAQWLENFSLSK